jgi:hypothetical protein
VENLVPQRAPSGELSEVVYDQGWPVLLASRLKHIMGLLSALVCFSAIFWLHGDFGMIARLVVLGVFFVAASVNGRNSIYNLRFAGSRLSLATAFSRRDLSSFELKDLYQPACGYGKAYIWELRTSDSTYRLEARDNQSQTAMENLRSKIQDPPSMSWLNYRISRSLEVLLLLPFGLMFCLAVGFIAMHAPFSADIVVLPVFAIVLAAINRTSREVLIKADGIEVTNLLRIKKVIPWGSIKSIKRQALGTIVLDSKQGKAILSSVCGFNVLVEKIFKQIPKNLYIDDSVMKRLPRR